MPSLLIAAQHPKTLAFPPLAVDFCQRDKLTSMRANRFYKFLLAHIACRLRQLLVFIALAPVVAYAQSAQSETDFINDFVTVALGREYGGANAGQLIKWIKPIRIGVTGEEGLYYLPAVEQHIADLKEIINHPITLVRGGEADIMVIFLKKLAADEIERYRPLYRPFFANDEAYELQLNKIRNDTFKAVCLTTIRTVKSRGELTGGIVFIPAEKKAAIAWQCIVEEITQALGLPNDSDTNFHSIFNDRSPHISLTSKDKRMLRLLYDPRLKPNMREAEVRQVASEVLKSWDAR